jgi:hypothetical protein
MHKKEVRIFDHHCRKCNTLFKSERQETNCPHCLQLCFTNSSHIGDMVTEGKLAEQFRRYSHKSRLFGLTFNYHHSLQEI